MTQSRGALLLVAGTSLLLLWLAAPLPRTALAQLLDAGTATTPTGPLVAAIALLAWLAAGWLALTTVLTLAARLPGLAGRASAAAARRVAPAAVRSAVEVALGVTVAVGLTSTPALAAAEPRLAVDLDWPVAVPPAPQAPAAPSTTGRPAVAPAAAPVPGAPIRAAVAVPVVVVPGDTLWGIAERALERSSGAPPTDAAVAAAWPRWWAANRQVVGDDPDLILPGTVLQPPAADR